jgi:hypothetical protein
MAASGPPNSSIPDLGYLNRKRSGIMTNGGSHSKDQSKQPQKPAGQTQGGPQTAETKKSDSKGT